MLDRSRRSSSCAFLVALAVTSVSALAQGLVALDRSPRSLVAALRIERDGAQLVAYTVKPRPWQAQTEPEPRAVEDAESVQLEVVLHGPNGASIVRRVDIAGLCLDHGPDSAPHIQGDTIRLHRESLLVELPEWAGFDRLDLAYYRRSRAALERVALGTLTLTPEQYTPAAGAILYHELAFARADSAPTLAPLTPGTVHWPEEFGDPDTVRVFGNPAETAQRINIVLVPDGYTHAEKGLLETHAQSLVDYFRTKSPYAEHDPFINYNLVYAYSTQSGTDQCDCSVVRDTAMNTRFPNAGYPCGDSGNRCLFYGTGNGGPNCDPNTSDVNIAAAELRAPAKDVTLVMVNTTRYGGCGGSRAVYAAGNSSATEIAVHELGHSLAGLADEYESNPVCGTSAGEINSSRNAVSGAWPEWVAEIGSPVQGAQYYSLCLYRPMFNCDMRALSQPFCPVCKQRFALTFFGHPRVSPSAPIQSFAPATPLATTVGRSTTFSVTTRLATGAGVTNDITWKLQGPGFPTPTTIATGTTSLTRSFTDGGTYTLSCEVIADTNFIKPSRTGANRDVTNWTIEASAIREVSGSSAPVLKVSKAGTKLDLQFEDVGADRYNIYVSTKPSTTPFQVSSPALGKRDCNVAVSSAGPGLLQVKNYDAGAGITGSPALLSILITADNGSGTEGPLGTQSAGPSRTADAYCAR